MFFMPPMSLGLTRYSRAGGSGIPFDPSILFSNGEQGAWYDPDEGGIDRGGSANVLTRNITSPAGAFVSGTALVEVERVLP